MDQERPTGQHSSLRRQAFHGIGWTTAQTIGTRAISAVVFIVLARLLQPSAFGLVSLAVVFVTLLEVFVEQGFAQAIIQREVLEPGHLDSAFWSSVSMGALMTIIGLVCAGPISTLMNQPDLAPVLQALCPILLIGGLASTAEALLRRELAFRSLAIRTVAGTVAGGTVGLAAAFAGLEVWSLVAQMLVQVAVSTIVLWLAVSWRPGVDVSWQYFRELFAFSSNIIGIDILNFLNRQSDNFMIGVVLGPQALGYYTVGYRILLLLTDVLTRTIDAVTLPTFSRVQDNIVRMRRAYMMATRLSSSVATPVYLALAATAPEVIHVIFGPKWDPAVPVMQVLAFIGILHANLFFNTSVLIAVGQPRKALLLSTINAVTNLIAFAVAVHWGIVAVAAAYVIRGYLVSPLQIIFVKRLLHFSWRSYLPLPAIPFGCAAIMLLVIFGTRIALDNAIGEISLLVILCAVGAVSYTLAIKLIARQYVADAAGFIEPVSPTLAHAMTWIPWGRTTAKGPDG